MGVVLAGQRSECFPGNGLRQHFIDTAEFGLTLGFTRGFFCRVAEGGALPSDLAVLTAGGYEAFGVGTELGR